MSVDKTHLVVVTDPMCSWCWGMAADLQKAQARLADTVHFELMLGGINTHGTQPIGDYGRRFLFRLWREVEATTGQPFGYQLPQEYIHNSLPPCVALELLRERDEQQVFAALHAVQERFFCAGENVTDIAVLADIFRQFDISRAELKSAMGDTVLREKLRFQFDNAGSFGTQALPSLLIKHGHELRLLAGGYVDADMLQLLVNDR